MKNDIQTGEIITVLAPAAVTSGQGVLVGFIFGVAVTTAAISAPVEISMRGVYDLTKTAGEAWVPGALLYWNDATKALTTTVGTNRRVAKATASQAAGDVIGRAYLSGEVI